MTDKALEAALPGEAEVVRLVEELREQAQRFSDPTNEMLTDAADVLQAMQALAEAAEDRADGWKLQWEQETKAKAEVLSWYTREKARAEKAEREMDALREALKPSGETKAEYIGEFTIAVERYVNSDEDVDDEGEGAMDPYEHVTVPWTTIKEIMAAISKRAARTALKGGSNG